MSRTVTACPACDSTHLRRRNTGVQLDSSEPDWGCNRCGATFSEPVARPAKNQGGNSAERVLAQFRGESA